MKTHQITKKEFNDFKKAILKDIPRELKKSPSEFLSSVATLYVMLDGIECDILHINFKDGSYLYVPINRTPILNEISRKYVFG